MPFTLEGENGFLQALFRRVQHTGHALVVAAEGAGQEWFDAVRETDLSSNIRLQDIGFLLKERIERYFKDRLLDLKFKYIDQSYMIRGCPLIPRIASTARVWHKARSMRRWREKPGRSLAAGTGITSTCRSILPSQGASRWIQEAISGVRSSNPPDNPKGLVSNFPMEHNNEDATGLVRLGAHSIIF